jgi:predicted transcriptional regulator
VKEFNDYEDIIWKYLSVAGRGVTTRKVATKTMMSWVTAKKYLLKLKDMGLVANYEDNHRTRWARVMHE